MEMEGSGCFWKEGLEGVCVDVGEYGLSRDGKVFL